MNSKKTKLFILIFVMLISVSSVFGGYKYYQNVQIKNKENAIKKEIENKIEDLQNSAQQGKYHDSLIVLNSLRSEYDLSKYTELETELDALEKEWKTKSDSNTNIKSVTNTSEELHKEPPSIGMTADALRKSSWGRPKSISKTTTTKGISEQWIYSKTKYIILKDGVVDTIQE